MVACCKIDAGPGSALSFFKEGQASTVTTAEQGEWRCRLCPIACRELLNYEGMHSPASVVIQLASVAQPRVSHIYVAAVNFRSAAAAAVVRP